MKKIVLLTALTMLLQTSVSAEGIRNFEAAYDVKTQAVTVSGMAEAEKTLMVVMPANQESGKPEDITDLADGNVFEKIKMFGEIKTDTEGAFAKAFALGELPDGTYKIYLGANFSEAIENTTFRYISPSTVANALQEISGANAEAVTALLDTYQDELQIDLSDWNLLGDVLADAEILLVGSLKPENGFTNIQVLCEAMEKAGTIAGINLSEDADAFYTLFEENRELLGVDFSVYDAIGTEETRIEKQKKVCEMLYKEELPITDLDAFSEAVSEYAMQIDLTLPEDWAYLQEMVTKTYADSLEISATTQKQYDALKSKANVFKNIYQKEFEDISEIEEAFKDEVSTLYKKQQNQKNNNTSGGGGGGGGGGGAVVVPSIVPATSTQTPQVIPQQPAEVVTPKDDLSEAEWARADMEALKATGVLSGDGTGNLYPNREITREEFVTMVIKAFAIPESDAELQFVDVVGDAWYVPFVKTAYAEGLVSGISADQFGTGTTISRQDMATIFYRLAQKKGIQMTPSDELFPDMELVLDYAKDAVLSMKQSGVITGMEDGSFSPITPATRAQTAVMLNRLLALSEEG